MASVEELDSLLQSLQALKPPGVSKSKIEAINTLCITHVGVSLHRLSSYFSRPDLTFLPFQSDSTLVEKIVTNFKTAPSTHKLGVLYVVDSVTRQWIEKARQTGQALIGSAAAPGTYASGVHKMTTVLPTMMNETIIHAPETQKVSRTICSDCTGSRSHSQPLRLFISVFASLLHRIHKPLPELVHLLSLYIRTKSPS